MLPTFVQALAIIIALAALIAGIARFGMSAEAAYRALPEPVTPAWYVKYLEWANSPYKHPFFVGSALPPNWDTQLESKLQGTRQFIRRFTRR